LPVFSKKVKHKIPIDTNLHPKQGQDKNEKSINIKEMLYEWRGETVNNRGKNPEFRCQSSISDADGRRKTGSKTS
jgi:hypothetical protein